MIENKKIFVLGMARSGFNVAKLLASKNEVVITDMKDQDENNIKVLNDLGVKFIKTDKPLDYFDDSYDLVIKNPGIFMKHELIQKAIEYNIPVVNEMEVSYSYLPKDVTIIGITGSNGKTTTTTMVYEILKLMGKNVILGGNIGYPLSEKINDIKSGDILVLEISDHQLINFKNFKTNISVLTNIYPTHLDFHGSFEKYKLAKKNIFLNHTKNDLAIINKDNNDSMDITMNIISTKKYFNDDKNYVDENGNIIIDNEIIINTKDILLKGSHNYENILACLLVLKEFGINKDIIKKYFSEFKGVEHRIEFVKDVNGIKYYNDSKSTNPTSTVVALKSFSEPTHLILGGMERMQDFHEMDNAIKNVKCIYAVGEVTNRVFDYAESLNIKCIKCNTLNVAMDKINENIEKGDIVLLSPASASWDQYAKFEDRGNEFKEIVNNL